MTSSFTKKKEKSLIHFSSWIKKREKNTHTVLHFKLAYRSNQTGFEQKKIRSTKNYCDYIKLYTCIQIYLYYTHGCRHNPNLHKFILLVWYFCSMDDAKKKVHNFCNHARLSPPKTKIDCRLQLVFFPFRIFQITNKNIFMKFNCLN